MGANTSVDAVICAVEDCDSPFYCKTYCIKHYERWRKYGDPSVVHIQSKSVCAVEGCESFAHAQGMCGPHRYRYKKYGNPLTKGNPGRKRKESLTYAGAHKRVLYDRGRVTDQDCVDCGRQAQEWSYVGGDPNEMTATSTTRAGATTVVRYSGNPNYYAPRCIPCHRSFDGSNDALNRGD